MISPPYSPVFVRSLLRVVSATTEALRSLESRELVREFVLHCNNSCTTPPFYFSFLISKNY